jgi:hypothetical protein
LSKYSVILNTLETKLQKAKFVEESDDYTNEDITLLKKEAG